MPIRKIKFTTHDDFLVKRSSIDGIGASDIGTIFGLNEYKSPLDFFYEKIGIKENLIKDSPAMYRGRVQEEVVATNYWQYYDPKLPGMDTLLENVGAKKIVRRVRKNNHIYINSKFPHLYCTPDYTYKDMLIEVKTVQGYAHAKWKSPVHESYILQVQDQLMVTGKKYGEVALMKDATFFECYGFEANKELQEAIVERTLEMWNKIVEGRNIMKNDVVPMEERLHMIYAIEPGVEATEAYERTLKDAYNRQMQVNSIPADGVMLATAKSYVSAKKSRDQFEDAMLLESNGIRKIMKDNDAGLIDFGAFGKIFYDSKNALQIKVKFD